MPTGDGVRVYALHIGSSKIPYGQFYGGTEGWIGFRGAIKFLTDKSHYITAPIYAYLIRHPDAGLILVDTGINWRQANEHHSYYDGPLLHATLDDDEYQLDHHQELSEHFRRLHVDPDDVQTVILTHLHEDHIGGLADVPHATVLVTYEEWRSKAIGIFPYKNSTSLKKARQVGLGDPRFIDFSSGPFYAFDRSQDLLGDQSVRLLPTPGHTVGHISVLVEMGECRLLCVGDTMYSLRHLAIDQVRPIALSKGAWRRQADSIRRIGDLQKSLPHTIIAPAHDDTAYARNFLSPFLSDGRFSQDEMGTIERYQAQLFRDNGRLPMSFLPHFQTARDSRLGTVAEPEIIFPPSNPRPT